MRVLTWVAPSTQVVVGAQQSVSALVVEEAELVIGWEGGEGRFKGAQRLTLGTWESDAAMQIVPLGSRGLALSSGSALGK